MPVGKGGYMAIDGKIGFIGGGNMAEALIKGLLTARIAPPENIIASDSSAARREHLEKGYGIIVQADNIKTLRSAEIVLLCVKPQVIDAVLSQIAPSVDARKLVISIAAGISLERIEKALGASARVIRAMPNTPALVLAGATGLAAGKAASPEDMRTAQEIFEAVGRAVVIEEKLMDAVTGLSGSGPAYIFIVIDALADAGVKAGIPRPLALELSAQTVYGAAKMVLETGEHPGRLRDMVTSPGGTTIAGLHELERGGLRAVLMNAVEAATHRSKELGKGNHDRR